MENQSSETQRIACCPLCPPYSRSILYSKDGESDVAYCNVHGRIPITTIENLYANG